MDFNPVGLLATGGIAAAVVAGWSQVKSFFSYLSSFVVIRADVVGHPLMGPTAYYFRTRWKIVPSGLSTITGKYFALKSMSNINNVVPFKILNSSTIFRRGMSFVVLTIDSGKMTLRSVRGIVNFEEVLREAVHLYQNYYKEFPEDRYSRFEIKKVIGREKTLGVQTNESSANLEEVSPSRSLDSSSGENYSANYLDYKVDFSFAYSKEEYLWLKVENPLEGLFYPKYILDYLAQAEKWFTMGEWYKERNLPWRRGLLVYGPGGTGKSSLATVIGKKFGIPVYQYYLATLSDQEFIQKWERMVTPCIALFEDFDNIFNGREPQTEHKSLTFDCVLNQISGVSAVNGVFLLITTNLIEKIDPAMGVATSNGSISTRPGRIDTVLYMGPMEYEERLKMALHILRDWPTEAQALARSAPNDFTAVQFNELCVQKAFDLIEF